MARSLSAAAFLFLAAAGCQSARMAVPPELESGADAWPCIGRGGLAFAENFSFGPYRVSDVRRSWTRRVSWSVAFYGQSSARQRFEFSLQSPSAQAWQAQAATGMRRDDLKESIGGGQLTWGLSRNVEFAARIAPAGDSNAWTLALSDAMDAKPMQGVFSGNGTSFRVEGTHKLAGSSIPLSYPSGFLVFDGPRIVAAIDVVNAGSVYFDRSLPESLRDPLAAASAALLLYRDISGD